MVSKFRNLAFAIMITCSSWLGEKSSANELPLRRDCARIASQAEKLLSRKEDRRLAIEVVPPKQPLSYLRKDRIEQLITDELTARGFSVEISSARKLVLDISGAEEAKNAKETVGLLRPFLLKWSIPTDGQSTVDSRAIRNLAELKSLQEPDAFDWDAIADAIIKRLKLVDNLIEIPEPIVQDRNRCKDAAWSWQLSASIKLKLKTLNPSPTMTTALGDCSILAAPRIVTNSATQDQSAAPEIELEVAVLHGISPVGENDRFRKSVAEVSRDDVIRVLAPTATLRPTPTDKDWWGLVGEFANPRPPVLDKTMIRTGDTSSYAFEFYDATITTNKNGQREITLGVPITPRLEKNTCVVTVKKGQHIAIRNHNNDRFAAGVTVLLDGVSTFAFSEITGIEHYMVPSGAQTDIKNWFVNQGQGNALTIGSITEGAYTLTTPTVPGMVGSIRLSVRRVYQDGDKYDSIDEPDLPRSKGDPKGTASTTTSGSPIAIKVGERISERSEIAKAVIGRLRETLTIVYVLDEATDSGGGAGIIDEIR